MLNFWWFWGLKTVWKPPLNPAYAPEGYSLVVSKPEEQFLFTV